MSRLRSVQGAIALLAKGLVQLAAAVRAVDSLGRGPHRVRAALAVLRAHADLGEALGGELRVAWAERGRAPLERALSSFGGEINQDFDVRSALLAAACSGSERRIELLVRGLGLRGRAAILHRVMLELETSPGDALCLAERAPEPWTAEATRLAASGVARFGTAERFVGIASSDSADRFPASRALACALARAGQYDAFVRVSRALGSCDAVLEAVALLAAGDRSAALGRLARLSTRERDRALLGLVSLEIEQLGVRRAEALAQRIGSQQKRAWAFAQIVHADAIGLVVRRDLLPEIAHVAPLEHALLTAEISVARQSAFALFKALERAGKLLRQGPPQAALDDRRPSSWERAMRCALALALSDQTPPGALGFARATLRVLPHSPFLRRELTSVLPLSAERLELLVARLPAAYQRFGAVLRGLAIEARAGCLRVGEHVRQLDAFGALERPDTRDAAVVAGALFPYAAIELPRSASSPLRAAYDLGVALSPAADGRRRVLLNASRASLRAARGPEHAAVVRLRVATLRQLEGAGTAELAVRLLVECDLPKTARLELLDMVVRHRASPASEFLWANFDKLTAAGRDAVEVLEHVERLGAVEPGTAAAWTELCAACGESAACGWFTAFLSGFRHYFRRSASKRLLDACSAALRAGDLPADGRLAAELIARGIAHFGSTGLRQLFTRGSERDLEWVVLACEPDPDRIWPVSRWQAFVARLAEAGSVDGAVVSGLVRKLPGASARTAAALLSGRAPTEALEKPLDIGRGLALSYLDKRRELLSFLRIADCVGCCYSSDGPHHDGHMKTSRWILRLYQDPLSFGFHVHRAGDGIPVGFVFGGYGLVTAPALLLNGVYLRRQEGAVRAAVLDAIEHALARPLGIAQIGVGSSHGGAGELPSEYRLETRRGVRLRALRDANGALERVVYDDISRAVNEETELSLHYKALVS